ncbi:MAG: hypothetical protein L6Q54_12835 [Leptospiraceae bacterium]|nr:hypothetical protein [Leptospiraceae bacterium]
MLFIYVFNVELGQSVFIMPKDSPEYAMLIDCGNTPNFNPVDIFKGMLPKDSNYPYLPRLSNLTITNYDEDHFSGLPYLLNNVKIQTVSLSGNLSVSDIKSIKVIITEPIKALCQLKDTYTGDVVNYTPPYQRRMFSLSKSDFPNGAWDTNKLSQLVFLSYKDTTICIPGDLPSASWELLLNQWEVTYYLGKTNIFIASHHGREDGYNADVFKYCRPECIIVSDKYIIHGTQENMSSRYARHVVGDGICFQSDLTIQRKVITTRNDGNIIMVFGDNAARVYDKF